MKPVRPNDTLHASLTIVETTPSKRRADLGILKSRGEMFNQRGELVLTLGVVHFFGRSPSREAQTRDAEVGDECAQGLTAMEALPLLSVREHVAAPRVCRESTYFAKRRTS